MIIINNGDSISGSARADTMQDLVSNEDKIPILGQSGETVLKF